MTLGYGQMPKTPGLHTMFTASKDAVEVAVGLGASGVEVIVVGVTGHAIEAHPLVPVIQVAIGAPVVDVDLVFDVGVAPEDMAVAILDLVSTQIASRFQAHLFFAFLTGGGDCERGIQAKVTCGWQCQLPNFPWRAFRVDVRKASVTPTSSTSFPSFIEQTTILYGERKKRKKKHYCT